MRTACLDCRSLGRVFWFLTLAAVIKSGDVFGQQTNSIDPAFTPPRFFNNFLIGPKVALQPDGKILMHGQGFDTVNGQRMGDLVRYNADGTLDTSFSFFAKDLDNVFVAAAPTNGQIYCTVFLPSSSGFGTHTLIRLNLDGSRDNSFNAGAGVDISNGGVIREITVQPDGKVLFGGLYTTFNGTAQNGVIRLNSDGTVDGTWETLALGANVNPAFATGVWAPIRLQPDGKILVGGAFSSVGGVTTPSIVRLNSNGTVDTGFVPSGFTVVNGKQTRGLGLQSDGRIIIGGKFRLNGDSTIRPVIRLSVNGTADPTFLSTFGGNTIRDLVVLPDDRIVAVDDKVYRFSSSGVLDTSFVHGALTNANPYSTSGQVPGDVFTVVAQSSGQIVFAGTFDAVGTSPRAGIARLNSDGSLDSFDVGKLQNEVQPDAVYVHPDGRMSALGQFNEVNGQPRLGGARFLANGGFDSFNPIPALGNNAAGPNVVADAVVQPDGKTIILAGNGFGIGTFGGGTDSVGIVRVNTDGSLDGSFAADAVASAHAGGLFLQSDGKVILHPAFNAQFVVNNAGGPMRRLNANGTADSGFLLNVASKLVARDNSGNITNVYLPGPRPLRQLPNGKLLVNFYKESNEFRFGQLNTDGTLDTNNFTYGFTPVPFALPNSATVNDPVLGQTGLTVSTSTAGTRGFTDVAVYSDGRLLVAGEFLSYSGTPARGLIRLLADGTVDSTFNTGGGPQWVTFPESTNFFPRVDSVLLEAGGSRILVSGNFEVWDGVAANGFVALGTNGAVVATFKSAFDFNVNSLLRSFVSPNRLFDLPDGRLLVTGYFLPKGQAVPLRMFHIFNGNFRLAAPGHLGDGSFLMTFQGDTGRSYSIQGSGVLSGWATLTNFTSTSVSVPFLHTGAVGQSKFFYRVTLP